MVYVLPEPGPDLSARMLKVKSSTLTMSLAVLPEPRALSASLLVIETKAICGEGSVLSWAVAVILTSMYLWFGGHSVLGMAVTVSVGGVVSATVGEDGVTGVVTTVIVTFAVPVLPA